MAYHSLVSKSSLFDGYHKKFDIHGLSLLLIQQNAHVYLIENKCGHFGVPLESAEITESSIICSEHGIEFDLHSGEALCASWADCDPVRVFSLVEKEGELGVEL